MIAAAKSCDVLAGAGIWFAKGNGRDFLFGFLCNWGGVFCTDLFVYLHVKGSRKVPVDAGNSVGRRHSRGAYAYYVIKASKHAFFI